MRRNGRRAPARWQTSHVLTGDHDRIPALDGLRGLAAVIVVIHHTLLLSPVLWGAYAGPARGSLWLLADTPLRLIWAGDVAVAVFFVLSGYVLSRPALHGRAEPWGIYYRKRLLRLYFPVWAAVAFAVATLPLRPEGQSSWAQAQHIGLSAGDLVATLTLARPGQLDNALWSLRWEVLFSLALPLYVAAARWLRRFPLSVSATALLVVILAGTIADLDALRFLPVFGLGVLLADHDSVLSTRTVRWGAVQWLALGTAAVLLSSSRSYVLIAAGAAGILFVARASHAASARLSRPTILWLGRLSYSLYLTHLPVVLLASNLPVPAWTLVPVTVASALAVAVAFHRWVEGPALRLARRGRTGGTRPKSAVVLAPPAGDPATLPESRV